MMEVSNDPAFENDLQKWEGYDQIKNFYCMPEVPIDFDKLSRARLRYWDMNRHLYDESRLIQIDTHRPGDMGAEKASSSQVDHALKHWAIKHGPKDFSFETIKGRETKCEERQAVLKDKADAVAKEKKISELQLLVAKLTKAQDQKTRVAGKPPVKVSLTEPICEEISAVNMGRKRPSPAPLSLVASPRLPIASTFLSSDSNNQLAEELKKKEFEVILKQKRLQALELEMEAAKKELALRALQQQKQITQARVDLELQAIHTDKREMLHAAKQRQQFLHDQDQTIRYQQLAEDRLFMKESIRRQWQVEDRESENQARRNQNRDAIEMATRSNEVTILQSLLYAQRDIQLLPQQPLKQFNAPQSLHFHPSNYPQHLPEHHQLNSQPQHPAVATSPITSPTPPPHYHPSFSLSAVSSTPSRPATKYLPSEPREAPKYYEEPTMKIDSMFPELGSSSITMTRQEKRERDFEDMTVEEIEQRLLRAQEQLEAEVSGN